MCRICFRTLANQGNTTDQLINMGTVNNTGTCTASTDPQVTKINVYRQGIDWAQALFVIMCAYISALPYSLSVSFYPLLFESYGFSHELNGFVLCLRGIGSAGTPDASMRPTARATARTSTSRRHGRGRPTTPSAGGPSCSGM